MSDSAGPLVSGCPSNAPGQLRLAFCADACGGVSVNDGSTAHAIATDPTSMRRPQGTTAEPYVPVPSAAGARRATAGSVLVMTLEGEYEESPAGWVRDQVEAYERSGGREANTLLDT